MLMSGHQQVGKEWSRISRYATFRTMLDEILCYWPDLIEYQLAHQVLDPNGRACYMTKRL
jgi:hypothetical protein